MIEVQRQTNTDRQRDRDSPGACHYDYERANLRKVSVCLNVNEVLLAQAAPEVYCAQTASRQIEFNWIQLIKLALNACRRRRRQLAAGKVCVNARNRGEKANRMKICKLNNCSLA